MTWLQRFSLFFFRKKEVTVVFWVALVAFGVICYTTLLQRQGFPNVDVPISIVTGTYFVNDKQQVDAQVARPASDVIKALPVVKKVASNAGTNFFLLTIEYKDGTSSAAGNAAVQIAIQNAHVLPSSVAIDFKAIDAGRFIEQSDLLVGVYSATPSMPAEQLQSSAAQVAERLQKLDGVERTTVIKQVQTGVDPRTGQSQKEQRSFDRVGLHDGAGGVVYYPAVMVGVRAKPSTDALKLYDSIVKGLDSQANVDANVKTTITADFAEDIRSQVSSLQQNLLAGLVIVIIVSCLLISWRAGVATALSMSTVVLMTVATLYATGASLNTITLFALILSLGLIVDDTTIMVEAIDAHSDSQLAKAEVVANAVKRVARASVAGTLTTILAFAPMLFISGILGSFIRILPSSIIISLFISLLISLSLVPFLARFLLRGPGSRPRRFTNPVPIVERAISNGLGRVVASGQYSTWRRLLTGGIALVISLSLFMASVPLFGKLKFDIFPNTKDSNQLGVTLQYGDSVDIAQAQTLADEADRRIGDTLGKYLRRLSYQGSASPSSAMAVIDLVNYKDRTITSPQLQQQLATALAPLESPQLHLKVSQIDAGPPKDEYPFAVRIFDDDAVKANRFAVALGAFLQNREISRVNGTKARVVRLELPRSDSVLREGSSRYVEVRAGFDADDVSALVGRTEDAVKAQFDATALKAYGLTPDQLVYDFGNESNNQESFKSMLLAFPILLLVMYLLLLLQFRSFLQPLLIFIAIPFSFFGVALGLYLTHNPLSFFVMVGFFALIGIAVNNTILLVDYANQERDKGATAYQAIATALRARFRPLITTSLTSVVALIPLALSDPFWESLAVTLIFGLLSSTFLVVISFPYLYLLAEWARQVGHRWWLRSLWRPLQWVLDVVLFPIRLLRFVLWVLFTWHSAGADAILTEYTSNAKRES